MQVVTKHSADIGLSVSPRNPPTPSGGDPIPTRLTPQPAETAIPNPSPWESRIRNCESVPPTDAMRPRPGDPPEPAPIAAGAATETQTAIPTHLRLVGSVARAQYSQKVKRKETKPA